MKTYEKPMLVKFTDEELMELIVAGAACPLCYQGTYIVNDNNIAGCGAK